MTSLLIGSVNNQALMLYVFVAALGTVLMALVSWLLPLPLSISVEQNNPSATFSGSYAAGYLHTMGNAIEGGNRAHIKRPGSIAKSQ